MVEPPCGDELLTVLVSDRSALWEVMVTGATANASASADPDPLSYVTWTLFVYGVVDVGTADPTTASNEIENCCPGVSTVLG